VIGGAKVIKETADTVNEWTPDVIKPTGGPKTPLGRLSDTLGRTPKLAQEAIVGDVKRIFKRGATPLPEEFMVKGSPGTGGATGASSVLKTTGQAVATVTGDVSVFSPVATSFGPQVGAFSNVGLFNRARDRLDQTPQVGLKDLTGDLSKTDTYLDSSQRERVKDPEPVKIFEPDPVKQPDPFKPYEPEPEKVKEPEPVKPWTPEPQEPHPLIPIQDTRVIWDPTPGPPPPPPPPPPTWTRKVPAVSPIWGPGGGLWGGPKTRIRSKTKKKVYQVADPLRLIGSELNKSKKYKNPRKRSPLEMIF
jgi:hypothetical protein